jgi:orotidine-5'-phosphate decarboxylase
MRGDFHHPGIAVNNKNISVKDRLIFAMDVPDCDRARQLADELGDSVTFWWLFRAAGLDARA